MLKYGVVVIGAGNGGLAAAAVCARAGLKTLLLERHNIPGGSATSFVRGRYEFETSLHELVGDAPDGTPGPVMANMEEMGAKVRWVMEKSTYRLVVPAAENEDGFINEDGVRVKIDARMPAGLEAFARKLDELVPGSYDSCIRAFEIGTTMYDLFNYLETVEKPSLSYIAKNIPGLALIARIGSHTVKEVLDSIGMPPKAQGIFTTYWGYMGVPASKFDFLYYMCMMYYYVANGAAMPKLRSHEMSLAMDRAIRDAGGDIWYNSEVTKVLMKDGKPNAVMINGEKTVYADHFICNGFPNFVYSDLFEKNDIDKNFYSMANARSISCSLTTVYLGLNITREQLGMHDYSIFIAPDEDSDKQYQAALGGFGSGFIVMNCLNTAIPDCTPEGTCQLFLTTLTYGDVMRGVSPRDYRKYKNEVARDMIETCEKALGVSIMPHIEEIEIALPPTFSRYLNTPLGTPYGYMLDMWDSMLPRRFNYEKEQPFDNFLFVGASQERGDGYGSAYYSGMKAAGETIKKIREGK
ncbi:MAG: NAD(P)/FAD-dependent oxidoreductase [Clostridia bacterium]|nr:NAD(P)/FAD-dependent oxidoreductase [Clostridia bacterium]